MSNLSDAFFCIANVARIIHVRCSLITESLLDTLPQFIARIEILLISSMPICTYHPVVMLLNQIVFYTTILLPVVELTHRYHQFLFRLIFAFVIIFNALLWFCMHS